MTNDDFPLTPHASRLTDLRPLIVLLGPTAVGKSEIAIDLAQRWDTEVLAADSRQVYRGMDIGTDKPSPAERRGVPHRLIDLVDPGQPFNVGEYRRCALAEIDRLHREGRLPLIVGGTGLYIRALVRGLWDGPAADRRYREQLEQEARAHGAAVLYDRLKSVDPDSAARLHERDLAKIIRALEVHHLLGRPLSEAHRRHAFAERPFNTVLVGLIRDREALYRRVEQRVEAQLAKGLVEETRRLLEQGYGRQLGSMKGLGYRQMAGYVMGEYPFEEAVRQLKRDTRHFVKRQLTWFRRDPVHWMQIEEGETSKTVAERIDLWIRSGGVAMELDRAAHA
jgi:tRNA dimethylallyltransferase